MLENMLDYLRIALYVVLFVLAFLLFQAWQSEHPPALSIPSMQQHTVIVPRVKTHAATQVSRTQTPLEALSLPMTASLAKGQIVKVTTDLLEVSIDTLGGDIVEAKFLKYPASLDSKQPFVLLNNNSKTRYLAESGLLSQQGPDTSQSQALYTVPRLENFLSANQNNLSVDLHWRSATGVDVTKTFVFKRGSYEIDMRYAIDNQSNEPWKGNLYDQLMRTDVPPEAHSGLMNLATYFGAAISTPDKVFEKISFKEMRDKNISRISRDGWAAMLQHYFISAWIPPSDAVSTYYSQVAPNGLYTIGFLGPELKVAPGEKALTHSKLYIGPTIASYLEKAAPNLKLTIDYGWFWLISVAIFWLMEKIYDVVGNWGWSIVLVTILIKLLFYQLSAKSYRSMSAMKKLQPRIELLKERYGDDRQKLTQATLELYREEKVNPMSGCLPILIQIPVFIALYWVLVESVQLRQAPFILWIRDLTQPDPYYVLPILMGISMFLQQRLNPPPPDPLQAKIMLLMPVIFTVLFANFPSGLMLYWFVNNTLSFLQQWHIMHRLNKSTTTKNALVQDKKVAGK